MPLTFGSGGSPSQVTTEFDTLLTASLANYQPTLVDNISKSNPFFKQISNSEGYEGKDGGVHVDYPLMYALGDGAWFDGYDTLNTEPMDGTTMSIWQWREAAIPITVSHREIRQNAQKIHDLVDTKMKQAEMGFEEFMGKALLQGAAVSGGNVIDPQTNVATGAVGFDPLFKLIQVDPTANLQLGNINQSTNTWWQNNTKSSTASSYDAFFTEVQGIYNDCSKGPGGPPDLMLCDQYTFQMFERMLYNRSGSRHETKNTLEFPFEHIKWKNAKLAWDEFFPDLTGNAAAVPVDSATSGAIAFVNSKFVRVFYDTQTNFLQTDWKSAINQPNAKTKHIMWMGGTAVTNRRKLGVLHGIDTTIAS